MFALPPTARPGRVRGSVRLGMVATVVATLLVAACTSGSQGGDRAGSAGAEDHRGHAAQGQSYSVPPAAPPRDGEQFVNLTMPEPYTPTAPNGGTDEYRCFLVDPQLNSQRYLTGSQFLPQNATIVHHAIFFRISPADADTARQLDASTPGEGWTCFGNSGVSEDAAWVAAWAPGMNETLLQPGLGYSMPPGSMLVMQIHYNLLATEGKAGGSDQSGIRLRLADGAAKMQPLQTSLLPAPVELPCTAAESGPLCDRTAAVADVVHRFGDEAGATVKGLNQYCNGGRPAVASVTQHCDRRIPQAGTIYAVAGHMHLLGRSIKIELNPGTPTAQTLLDVPNYNFDDQSIRPLSTSVAVKPGDMLRVTCTHDAGLRKLLPQLRTQPARYVVWGDGTSDEMCLGLVIWTPAG
jgi:Copper type II ascorbate-dependent monooxygenase, C-terminal domain